MKEDWIEELRQKLEGHEVPPPEGLWESISKELGIAEEPPMRQKTSFVWLRWAAAAVVLALVGLFVYQHIDGDKALPQEAAVATPSQTQAQAKVTAKAEAAEQPVTEPEAAHPAMHQALALLPKTTQKSSIIAPDSKAVAQVTSLPDSTASVTDAAASPSAAEESQPEATTRPSPDASPSYLEQLTTSDYQPRQHHPDGKWTIELNASGGLLAANSSGQALVYDQALGSSKGFIGAGVNGQISSEYNDFNNLAGYEYRLTDYVSEHHLPLRVGLNLHYRLSPHLALLSGVNYTYLYSQFRVPRYKEAVYDQKLHYLGVPLGVVWQLWQTGSFRFYVSASTLLEKCLNDEPWQWSVNAAAGAEYGFSRQLGFYLEPSLGYYFDDGTPLEHYYKEHPFAPSIEFGLRLHLNE